MGSKGILSKRAVNTESPVMVQIQELLRGVKGAISLAQVLVFPFFDVA
ncbi:hypothetical protein HanHA300_Chr16g0592191 [Helianthus annuus]|nr:hypothetical protein HanHA300_Chr16g0592191 [Helianthus annuus]KAJ0639396.1 hypothetical protein HanLR1_Chr16g0603431 [Helianthus annuus]KAJ0643381.1 hypothetical protein HanOQP8_Chr16g0599931 [Helianthus annuus]